MFIDSEGRSGDESTAVRFWLSYFAEGLALALGGLLLFLVLSLLGFDFKGFWTVIAGLSVVSFVGLS